MIFCLSRSVVKYCWQWSANGPAKFTARLKTLSSNMLRYNPVTPGEITREKLDVLRKADDLRTIYGRFTEALA